MKVSPCYLFSRSVEFCEIEQLDMMLPYMKGIYVLYQCYDDGHMEVVYIGVGLGKANGIKGQLMIHRDQQPNVWSHFSVFEVWDNITKKQIKELAGFFRHVYRQAPYAMRGAAETKEYEPLVRIRRLDLEDMSWRF